MISKHIIIHIDATNASSNVRRKLFTSTREGFKNDVVLKELTRVLTNIVREDERLYEIEDELLDNLLQKETEEVDKEVQRQIASLLLEAGFKVENIGDGIVAGKTGPSATSPPRPPRKRKLKKADPLKTLPYPQVTKFEIVYPQEKLVVHQKDNHIVRIETDADFKFGRKEGILAIRAEPNKLEVASQGLLSGGRMHWRLRPTEDSSHGDTGEIIATLTKPDGSQMTDKLPYEILPVRVENTRKMKGLIPSFNISGIDPYEDPDGFAQIWPDVTSDEIPKIAYKAIDNTSKGLFIYYSKGFTPYREQADKIKNKPALAQLFQQNYKIWIGYHAILQLKQLSDAPTPEGLDDEELQKLRAHERSLVAEMQAKQAIQMADIQHKSARNSAAMK